MQPRPRSRLGPGWAGAGVEGVEGVEAVAVAVAATASTGTREASKPRPRILQRTSSPRGYLGFRTLCPNHLAAPLRRRGPARARGRAGSPLLKPPASAPAAQPARRDPAAAPRRHRPARRPARRSRSSRLPAAGPPPPPSPTARQAVHPPAPARPPRRAASSTSPARAALTPRSPCVRLGAILGSSVRDGENGQHISHLFRRYACFGTRFQWSESERRVRFSKNK